jgi:hypothetical protein
LSVQKIELLSVQKIDFWPFFELLKKKWAENAFIVLQKKSPETRINKGFAALRVFIVSTLLPTF